MFKQTLNGFYSINQVVKEDKSILPIHTVDADLSNVNPLYGTHGNFTHPKEYVKKEKIKDDSSSEEDSDDTILNRKKKINKKQIKEENKLHYDEMTLLGDEAAYFTINKNDKNPTVL